MECLTTIATSIASEIANSLVAPVTRQIGYLIFYNSNIEELREEIEQLNDKNAGLDLRIEEAKRNLQIIAPEVVRWREKVELVKKEVEDFLEVKIKSDNKCLKGLCTDPKSRHSLSRKAKKMILEIVNMLEKAGKFTDIAYPGPPPALGSTFDTKGIQDFESRASIMNEVLKALEDDELSMISICGMGGVGKTTMVQKLVKRVDKLFDDVAMAIVSQNPNLEKIQEEIASHLGLKFESQFGRQNKLHQRLMDPSRRRILLILDDVWDQLKFGEIGLPSAGEREGYKIVLTSRNEDVCNRMGSQRNFQLGVLSDDEAWTLFREKAGDSVEHNSDINPIARQVAKECGGLPIAIVTVARALGKKSKDIWKSALQELQKSRPKNISGLQNEVFSRIELSYNYLESEEVKLCFLLCCLFPEDFSILVDDLVRYAMGLGLFEDVDNFARSKI